MYSRAQLVKKYVHYYFTASNGKGHGIHSPFVFDFVRHVLNDTRTYDAYANVERLRAGLLRNNAILNVRDMGAGSVVTKSTQRKVSAIARYAAKPSKYGRLLFRIIHYYKPATIIELGTSLGITTAYLALANPGASVVTLEGAPEVAAVAKINFQQLGLLNVRLIEGNFNTTLSQALQLNGQADCVFIDGNHLKAPTMLYFNTMLACIHPLSILIFDDIHWSKEMEEAWEEIKNHPSVTLTIDLFFTGLVFFRKEFIIKQHFVIRF